MHKTLIPLHALGLCLSQASAESPKPDAGCKASLPVMLHVRRKGLAAEVDAQP